VLVKYFLRDFQIDHCICFFFGELSIHYNHLFYVNVFYYSAFVLFQQFLLNYPISTSSNFVLLIIIEIYRQLFCRPYFLCYTHHQTPLLLFCPSQLQLNQSFIIFSAILLSNNLLLLRTILFHVYFSEDAQLKILFKVFLLQFQRFHLGIKILIFLTSYDNFFYNNLILLVIQTSLD
jgi:hypothetical protein